MKTLKPHSAPVRKAEPCLDGDAYDAPASDILGAWARPHGSSCPVSGWYPCGFKIKTGSRWRLANVGGAGLCVEFQRTTVTRKGKHSGVGKSVFIPVRMLADLGGEIAVAMSKVPR